MSTTNNTEPNRNDVGAAKLLAQDPRVSTKIQNVCPTCKGKGKVPKGTLPIRPEDNYEYVLLGT